MEDQNPVPHPETARKRGAPSGPYRSLCRYTWLAIAAWTILIGGLLFQELRSERSNIEALVLKEARVHFNKDLAFRRWGTIHGGVYVPVTEMTPPNPYLTMVPERDIVTPSGRSLTLMNPAYMMRQMMDLYTREYGVRGRITSMKALNPMNVPDAWERKALQAFEEGTEEISELAEIDGVPYLRLMRPLTAEPGCLKCHGHQGYKSGDIRGGIGVSVPMRPYLDMEDRMRMEDVVSYAGLGLSGLAVIGLVAIYAHRRIREQQVSEEALRQKEKERGILQGQLRQAQKMEAIGTLAGGIAHDFNNILFVIMGSAELAKLRTGHGGPALTEIEEIQKAANRAKDLVSQILAFSRRSEKAISPMAIQPLAKEALKLLRATIPTTIAIETRIDPACRPVMADATQIHQVIMNLCMNSYQAMRERGGVLTVSLGEEEIDGEKAGAWGIPPGPYARLSVEDTGPGMAPAVLERIFEPYFTTKPIGEGTGLGLSVVHGIVQAGRGHIAVASRPGGGTVFDVHLPVVAQQQAGPAGPAEPADYSLPRGRERLLVVDDERSIAQMEREMLSSLGYEVKAASRADQALAIFDEAGSGFDLVVTDMTMPGMTGLDLAIHLKEKKPDLPVILCTGYSELVDAEKLASAGIATLLMKPVTISQLAQAVRSALDTPTAG